MCIPVYWWFVFALLHINNFVCALYDHTPSLVLIKQVITAINIYRFSLRYFSTTIPNIGGFFIDVFYKIFIKCYPRPPPPLFFFFFWICILPRCVCFRPTNQWCGRQFKYNPHLWVKNTENCFSPYRSFYNTPNNKPVKSLLPLC